MPEWFYVDNGEQAGPASASELQQKAVAGQIQPDTLVWKEGMADWTPYSQVAELQVTSAPNGPAPAAPVTGIAPADPARQPTPQPVESVQPMGSPIQEFTPSAAGEPSEIGQVSAGEALGKGWSIFSANMGSAIVISLVFGLVLFGAALVGAIINMFTLILGSVLMVFVVGWLLIGLAKVAITFADGGKPTVGTLFPDSSQILMPGLANIVHGFIGSIIVGIFMIPVFVVAGASLMTAIANAQSSGGEPDPAAVMAILSAMGGAILLMIPLMLVAGVVVSFMNLWAPLAVDRGLNPVTAIFTSFSYAMKSFMAYAIVWIVISILLWIGGLLLGIGAIFTGAYCLCVYGVMYRQIVPASS